MKVLHIGKFYPPYRGGMESHLATLCEHLTEFVKVKVLVANTARQTVEEVRNGVSITRLSTQFHVSTAPFCAGLARRIRATKADIVHIHLPNPTGVLAYMLSGHNGRLVVTYHSDVVRQKMLDAAFRPILKRFLAGSSAIICTSPNYITSSPVLRCFADLCRVVPFGIDIDGFERYDFDAVARIRGNYGDRLIVSIGRLVYYKGFDYLIRAMSTLDANLVIIGSGPLRDHLQDLITALRLQHRIHLIGEVKNVRPYMQAAQVFVLPSVARSEAFGIVQLEAMACGRPVVNTELDSGVPFVSPNGVTGLTVKPANSKELAGAIRLLLADPQLRDQYGRAARKRVESEFRVETMIERTLAVYSEACSPEPLHRQLTAAI